MIADQNVIDNDKQIESAQDTVKRFDEKSVPYDFRGDISDVMKLTNPNAKVTKEEMSVAELLARDKATAETSDGAEETGEGVDAVDTEEEEAQRAYDARKKAELARSQSDGAAMTGTRYKNGNAITVFDPALCNTADLAFQEQALKHAVTKAVRQSHNAYTFLTFNLPLSDSGNAGMMSKKEEKANISGAKSKLQK